MMTIEPFAHSPSRSGAEGVGAPAGQSGAGAKTVVPAAELGWWYGCNTVSLPCTDCSSDVDSMKSTPFTLWNRHSRIQAYSAVCTLIIHAALWIYSSGRAWEVRTGQGTVCGTVHDAYRPTAHVTHRLPVFATPCLLRPPPVFSLSFSCSEPKPCEAKRVTRFGHFSTASFLFGRRELQPTTTSLHLHPGN